MYRNIRENSLKFKEKPTEWKNLITNFASDDVKRIQKFIDENPDKGLYISENAVDINGNKVNNLKALMAKDNLLAKNVFSDLVKFSDTWKEREATTNEK